MEKFEDLLEKYLDEEEIEEKKKIDGLDSENEIKKSKYKHKFPCTIAIREFVNEYLETEHDCTNLRHIGLKSFENPYVIGISNDFASKNMEYVFRNEILIVVDSHNDPAAYINPFLIKQIETMEQLKYTLNILKKIRLHNLSNIKQLYDEFDKVNKQMIIIKNDYLTGNELLKKLNKKYILTEIREQINKTTNINISFEEKIQEIEENLITEYQLMEQIENVIDIVDIDFQITTKINRQKKLETKNKRKVLR